MENTEKYDLAIRIFEKNNGILRMSEAMRQGIPKHILYEMLSHGQVIREERGVYSLKDGPVMTNPDYSKVCLRVPKAVICLTSALYFYDLTTQVPPVVYIALPHNIRVPRIAYPPIDVIRLSPKPYFEGIEIQEIDGISVKIYSPEKTLTDCFKFRSKIGIEIAIEALKDYMKNYRPKLDKIIAYAKINRVEKIMRPYLEAVL